MDIPSTGAIFTLGKSHLAENTQSYFYIKNDPIKRLVSGPRQSAVICESGRLFVWGENHFGQLGIGGHGVGHNNNNNNDNTNDIITKPTCVKSLKTLGLKVADVAYGNDWAVILTHSNELFFTGRCIFDSETSVARNFSHATVENEECAIIRKPFRMEEFDDCLSKSEDTENFVTVLAGNTHFAVLTSFGRLIGWGSNLHHQLGLANTGSLIQPHEIKLDAPIELFTCGPESTLVLTQSGNLYLTGRLNEFVFSHFTELQKNLSVTEQIIFMHISKTNEIYIVTNAGSIYRSMESVRNNSLIFQRFYDYDSEEHGPIWKLLKGYSFYVVLTKAHKFFTTFSESGHHLKTFREISKFKNLRLLDMAVGDLHVLVHGIPRSSTLSATMGTAGTHRFMSRTYVMAAKEVNSTVTERSKSARKESIEKPLIVEKKLLQNGDANANDESSENNNGDIEEKKETKQTPKPKTPALEESIKETHITPIKNVQNVEEVIKISMQNGHAEPDGLPIEHDQQDDGEVHPSVVTLRNATSKESVEDDENVQHSNTSQKTLREADVVSVKSPTDSLKSRRSARSIKFEPTALEKTSATDKLLRPHTPYPENSNGNTPQTIKKTPLRNYSYEAAMEHDFLDHTSPALADSLEHIPEHVDAETSSELITAVVSSPTPPTEEDEQLTVEISTAMDALDRTMLVNEIRFINNGIDVTDNVKKEVFKEEDSLTGSLEESMEQIPDKADYVLDQIEHEIAHEADEVQAIKQLVKKQAIEATEKAEQAIESEISQVEDNMQKASHGAQDSGVSVQRVVSDAGNTITRAATDARDAVHKVTTGAGDAVHKAATGAGDAVHKAATGASDAMHKAATGAGDAMHKAMTGARETVQKVATQAEEVMQKAATGARDTVDTMGENARHMATDARQAVEHTGNNAAKAAGGAKNAVENVLFKMADGTKYAVDTVATKISNEMHEARSSISSMLQGKSTKNNANADDDETLSKETGGSKTNTTTPGEDDERTTASVNSTQNSVGNPFESTNPFENELDTAVERGKQALRKQAHAVEENVEQEMEHGKGKVQQFFSDMRAKSRGLSCRNEKAIRIEDEPPIYTVEDTTRRNSLALQRQQQPNTSKVCSIL